MDFFSPQFKEKKNRFIAPEVYVWFCLSPRMWSISHQHDCRRTPCQTWTVAVGGIAAADMGQEACVWSNADPSPVGCHCCALRRWVSFEISHLELDDLIKSSTRAAEDQMLNTFTAYARWQPKGRLNFLVDQLKCLSAEDYQWNNCFLFCFVFQARL